MYISQSHNLIIILNLIIIIILCSKNSFLAKRGVKEEIQTFDSRKINPDIRKAVEELLTKNKDSFDPKVFYTSSSIAILILL